MPLPVKRRPAARAPKPAHACGATSRTGVANTRDTRRGKRACCEQGTSPAPIDLGVFDESRGVAIEAHLRCYKVFFTNQSIPTPIVRTVKHLPPARLRQHVPHHLLRGVIRNRAVVRFGILKHPPRRDRDRYAVRRERSRLVKVSTFHAGTKARLRDGQRPVTHPLPCQEKYQVRLPRFHALKRGIRGGLELGGGETG